MRRVFGDEAYGIAGSCLDGDQRKNWAESLLKKLIRDCQDLDTTQRHREHISYMLESLLKDAWDREEPTWRIVFDLLMLIAELLGYEGARGERPYTPMYWQDLKTHVDIANSRGRTDDLQEEFQSAARMRSEVIKTLKTQGYSDFQIAMALKTSEHEVKKIKNG